MTELQFNEIKERLSKWRQERHLTYENQQAGFLGNVFEEISEYFRAKDNLERVDALCDIAVFFFNAFDFKYRAVSSNMNYYTFSDVVVYNIYSLFGARTDNLCVVDNENALYLENHLNLTMFEIEHLCKNLGFDFYKCMLQTIKEIESREQDPEQKKEWEYKIKNKIEIKDKWRKNNHQKEETKYKANYESCKLDIFN